MKVENGRFSNRRGPKKKKEISKLEVSRRFIEDIYEGQQAFTRRDDEERVKELITYTICRVKEVLIQNGELKDESSLEYVDSEAGLSRHRENSSL